MKVQIEGSLYLESDDKQFIILEYTGKFDDKGKEQHKSHGYFSTVEGAAKHLLKMKIKQSTATTLAELVQDVQEIKQDIRSKLGI